MKTRSGSGLKDIKLYYRKNSSPGRVFLIAEVSTVVWSYGEDF